MVFDTITIEDYWRAIFIAIIAITILYCILPNENLYHKRIIAGESNLHAYIRPLMEQALQEYSPTWWANCHVQLILQVLIPQAKIPYTREIIPMTDNGQIALDWATTSTTKTLPESAPIVVLCHGLVGCSKDMRTMCAKMENHGYRPVVFNKRGHGDVPLSTPTLQQFGDIGDLEQALEHIQSRYPHARVVGIGSSAGSGLLCSYLGEKKDYAKFDACVLISPGYAAQDLFSNNRIHPMYDFILTMSLRRLLAKHATALAPVINVPKALRSASIAQFDEEVYFKLFGHTNADTYWKDNCPLRNVMDIQRPVLSLNALDDPVCTKEQIRYDIYTDSPNCMLLETGAGSHCSFLDGPLARKSWSNDVAAIYLDNVLKFTASNIGN